MPLKSSAALSHEPRPPVARCSDAPWVARLARARAALAAHPYDGRAEIVRMQAFGPRPGLTAMVCVPARDEAALLPACLDALAAALRARDDAGVVLVVNNSADASARIAAAWAASAGIPAVCCEVRLAPPADTVAFARRLALDLAAAVAAPDAALLSTDADTLVPRDWVARMAAALDGGAALVVGGITVDPGEEAALPPAVRRTGVVEGALGAAYQAIWSALIADTPCPMLLAAGGANMAVSAAAYRAVGGLPTDRRNEDRALTERMIAAGLPIAVDRTIAVTTSLRTEARARHGMADAIAERCREADPHVDGLLVPLATFLARISSHRAGAPVERGGAEPLRLSEALAELASARALLARIEAAPSHDPSGLVGAAAGE